MKKILIILICSIFTSCLSSKKVTETNRTTNKIEKSEVVKDSVSDTQTNKAINDTITIEVPVTSPETDLKIDEILSKLNTKKSSGSNNYKIYYDKKLRELKASFQVGETKDTKTDTKSDTTTEKSFSENIDEYIYKKYKVIPWWLYAIVIIYFLPKIIRFLANFYPPLRTLNAFKGFF